jgi:hypothetical protein
MQSGGGLGIKKKKDGETFLITVAWYQFSTPIMDSLVTAMRFECLIECSMHKLE